MVGKATLVESSVLLTVAHVVRLTACGPTSRLSRDRRNTAAVLRANSPGPLTSAILYRSHEPLPHRWGARRAAAGPRGSPAATTSATARFRGSPLSEAEFGNDIDYLRRNLSILFVRSVRP